VIVGERPGPGTAHSSGDWRSSLLLNAEYARQFGVETPRLEGKARMKPAKKGAQRQGREPIKILFIAGFGPIVRDVAASRKLYGETLGIPFKERAAVTFSRADIAVSVITEAEVRTGAAKSSNAEKTRRRVENFLRPLSILEFTSEDAASYAQIPARLERAGTPIGPLDTLIAAQAVLRKLTQVTNNRREFSRIPGLRVENWSAD